MWVRPLSSWNCQDMGMRFVRGLSADMEDLLKEKGQQEAAQFMDYFLWNVEHGIYEPLPETKERKPLAEATPVEAVDKTMSKEVVIVTDCRPDNTTLQSMISRFQAKLPCKSKLVNIRDYPLNGGCLGCFNCAVSGKCIYTDGFDEFLRTEIQSGDAIVYAFTIKDHSMGAVFKMYDDRQFCNGHRTVTMGMPIGYIVSGHYSREENLRMILEGRCEVGGNFFAGVASDEYSADTSIDAMAGKMAYALEKGLIQPANFLGVGGMKIFRDLIYMMQGMMKADHKFFKAHGQYDFPQKQKGTILKMYLVGMLLGNPKLKSKMGNKMNEGMLAPYKKVLDAVQED